MKEKLNSGNGFIVLICVLYWWQPKYFLSTLEYEVIQDTPVSKDKMSAQLAAEKKTLFLVQLKEIFVPSYFDRALVFPKSWGH